MHCKQHNEVKPNLKINLIQTVISLATVLSVDVNSHFLTHKPDPKNVLGKENQAHGAAVSSQEDKSKSKKLFMSSTG